MTGTISTSEQNQRERALATLDRIRDALKDDDLQTAIDQIDLLQTELAGWKRREARMWLDNVLNGDLLLFNLEEANKRLKQWESTLEDKDDDSFKAYQSRVQRRGEQKQVDLQARGVSAHCRELWAEASQQEHSATPPKPEFVLLNYYEKARDVVAAAYGEHPNNATLSALIQQAERIVSDKRKADTVYKIAIEEDRYADALDMLGDLEVVALVPSYRVIIENNAPELLRFDKMIPVEEAREALDKRGRIWSEERAAEMQKTATDLLDNYQPQAAVDALADRKLVERFVTQSIYQKLHDLEARAGTDLRLLEQAERRARQAQRLANDNPMGAWDIYVEAYQTYVGAPALHEARAAIITAMSNRLTGLIREAEQAFNEKRMDRIQRIYQGARLDFGDKDEALEELLSHLAEIDRQASAYEDYLREARGILDRLQELVWQDPAAAGEMLTTLENFPGIVLEDLAELNEVRATVRRRLNLEVVYNQLRQLLISNNQEEIVTGMNAAQQYVDEERFVRLIDWLDIHRAYLEAQQIQRKGKVTQALALYDEIAQHKGHPDQQDAVTRAKEIRTASADSESKDA